MLRKNGDIGDEHLITSSSKVVLILYLINIESVRKNLISANDYDHVEDCTDFFQSVIETLDNLFVKSSNVIFARHLPSTRRQQSGETLNQFLQDLRKLSEDCKFKAVTAEQYREELVRDAFINGLLLPAIRERLLESDTLSLQIAYDKANSLDLAQKKCRYILNV